MAAQGILGVNTIYTIGHSDHTIERFIELLKMHGITEVADVRSAPYSRRHPQFNKDAITASLKKEGVAYVFLGKELGARPQGNYCYDGDGKADFRLIEKSDAFKSGIERVIKGRGEHNIALMCAEKEPLNCHRTLLVCRNLKGIVSDIKHILYDGTIEDHSDTEARLFKLTKCDKAELFMSDSERLELAYEKRGREIAYKL